MPKPTPRRFTLGDLMVLIAAVAVCFPLARWIRAELPVISGPTSYASFGVSNRLDYVWMKEPSCFAVVLTLVLIPLLWRRPRPPAVRVLRQPGAVACLSVAVAMVVGLAIDLGGNAIRRASYGPGVLNMAFTNLYYWGTAVRSIPLVVIGIWTALAVGGRWSPERSWIDRLGRFLGVFWVAEYPVGLFRILLNQWLPYKD